MAWVKLDDQARHHRKLLAAGPIGAWLWTCGLMYCNSQKAKDGFIPEAAVPVLYPIPGWRREAIRLVSVGLWERVEGGYKIHDYHEYQPSTDAETLGKKRAEAGRVGGQRSGEARRLKPFASEATKQLASEATNPVPSRPDPVPERSEIPLPPVGGREVIVEPEKPARVVDVGTARAQAACETFVLALADRGWTRGEVREPWERRALCDAINAHLRADGTAEGMLAELRRAVGDWATAKADAARFTSGWGARKFADWLAEGREVATGVRSVAPPPSDTRPVAEPEREYTAEEIAAIDAQVAASVERLQNAHRTLTPRPQHAPAPSSSGDMYERTPAEREAERQRQLAALAEITGTQHPSRVA